MAHRFYSEQLNEAGVVTLTETEAHHLMHVLRGAPNDIVDVFNGSGLAATCRIATLRKREVELEVVSFRRDTPPPTFLTLATGVPKGDRFDWLIEKATELGVGRIIPLVTSRSVVDPRTSKLDKLRQTVISACKQSGRNHLMEITKVHSWADFVKQVIPEQRVLIAHPQGDTWDSASCHPSTDLRPPCVAIGPEGGFSDEEFRTAISAGAHPVHLGRQILRIETAAIALAAKILL
jgi:16S rRNA (uracil1498-N3)-methyltransferase